MAETQDIFFTSAAHKGRFLETMQRLGKVERGNGDPEYASALYILTCNQATWNKARDYVSGNGIQIEKLLREVDFSGGYSVLIQLAGNLFNERTTHLDPVELMRLDETNFLVALTALQVRRYGYRVAEVQGEVP